MNHSTGIYDPKRGVFRKRSGVGAINGVSDILGVYKGRLFAIEVKSEKGRPTLEQVVFIQDVRRHGGIAFVAKNLSDVDRELLSI